MVLAGRSALRRRGFMALVAAALVAATACGGSDGAFPTEESSGCVPSECHVAFSNLSRASSFVTTLSLINPDGAETIDVTIVFTVQSGQTVAEFTNAAGEIVSVDVSAGTPTTVHAMIVGSGIAFRFAPDDRIEGGRVTITPAG